MTIKEYEDEIKAKDKEIEQLKGEVLILQGDVDLLKERKQELLQAIEEIHYLAKQQL